MVHVFFCLQLVALELAMRGPRFYASHPRAIAYAIASAAALHLVAALAEHKAARAVFALFLGVFIVLQVRFFLYYHAPIDDQVALAARRSWPDVRPMLIRALPALAALSAGVAAIEYAWLGRRPRGAKRHVKLALVLAIAGVLLGGSFRDGTLEVRVAHAATALALAGDPAKATHGRHDLPPLLSTRARVPNVLYIVTESVRATDHCRDVGDPCPTSPELARLLPSRVPLLEMRSIASYTAISMSALLTGLPQVGPREPIVAAPDLFDYLRAVRAGESRVGVHYWSAHSPSFFERDDMARVLDSFSTADTMLGHTMEDDGESITSGLDRRLADDCADRVGQLRAPYFAMVHFFGTHAPYFFDDDRAPFTPFTREITWSGLPLLHAAYDDAIVEQDRSIAKCARAFIDAQRGGPYVILFTSDHGEAFGDHSAIHHGQNLYDEQVHVPGFVAFGGGALEPAEIEALTAAKTKPVTHLDLLPTVLDAFGVLDHFSIAADRRAMPGRSLFRPLPPSPPIPITNCSAMWSCVMDAWGVLQDSRKIFMQPWDGSWRCLALDGGEHEVDLANCSDLVEASRAWFPKKPNGVPNR